MMRSGTPPSMALISAVNHWVRGSNPRGGVEAVLRGGFFYFSKYTYPKTSTTVLLATNQKCLDTYD